MSTAQVPHVRRHARLRLQHGQLVPRGAEPDARGHRPGAVLGCAVGGQQGLHVRPWPDRPGCDQRVQCRAPAGRSSSQVDQESYQISDDFTMVRGAHQIGVGGNYRVLDVRSVDQRTLRRATSPSTVQNGPAAGRLPQRAAVSPGARRARDPAVWIRPTSVLYAQDAWRLTNRVTVNAGLRWEPFFGQNIQNGAISNFSLDNFRNGVKSTVFMNAPAGLMFPGDPGFPAGNSGMNTQWWNLSPRVGCRVGRDRRRPHGGARLVRAGVRLHDRGVPLHQRPSAAPYANRLRLEAGRVRRSLCGRARAATSIPIPVVPPPDAPFPASGSFGIDDPRTSTRPASSRGTSPSSSRSARPGRRRRVIWAATATASGARWRSTPACSWDWAVHAQACRIRSARRRTIWISGGCCRWRTREASRLLGPVDRIRRSRHAGLPRAEAVVRRRAADGVSLSGNYTVSHCVGNTVVNGFPQSARLSETGRPVVRSRELLQNRRQVFTSRPGIRRRSSPVRRCVSWRRTGALSGSSTRARARGSA